MLATSSLHFAELLARSHCSSCKAPRATTRRAPSIAMGTKARRHEGPQRPEGEFFFGHVEEISAPD